VLVPILLLLLSGSMDDFLDSSVSCRNDWTGEDDRAGVGAEEDVREGAMRVLMVLLRNCCLVMWYARSAICKSVLRRSRE
jgi:hypothetical protein